MRPGVEDPPAAQRLVDAYFTWPRKQFVREFFKGRTDLLELATTDESWATSTYSSTSIRTSTNSSTHWSVR